MKAATYHRYGRSDVLQIEQIPMPFPAKNEVLVKVQACSINPRDTSIRKGLFKLITGNKFPKITCADFSGTIEGLGAGIKDFAVGDEVFGYVQSVKQGCLAEYISVPINWISKKSKLLSHPIVAAIPCTYLTALQALRNKAAIKQGDRVLIYGAAGGVGTAAIQLAKYYKANVTAVCNSRNAAYCKNQGADEVWCYDLEDIAAKEHSFDIVFQVYSIEGLLNNKLKHLVKKKGTYLTLIPSPKAFITGLLNRFKGSPALKPLLVKVRPDDLGFLLDLVLQGKLNPHISSTYKMEEIKLAHDLVDTNHAVGKLIITLNE